MTVKKTAIAIAVAMVVMIYGGCRPFDAAKAQFESDWAKVGQNMVTLTNSTR